ncbi:TPA: DUF551 domain-containing protein [Pseudomonas aeruginosa]|nr:DUF551 domain-containing protein [Pseudomonas aeruginosa]HBN9723540.1 DUF551 domain-containing protein [Pseudomonas aeruginosa]HBN9771719.1 DUF551 domain-containing protein [Pseudomonas aeruginosa]HBN9893462.1 DUF551 domain-containing protein [Pseudomonas aeruginosa]
MSEWIKCSDRMPEHSDEVMVWRKWPGWDCFALEFDRWVSDEGSDEGGFWMLAEDACQHIETCADGPGHVERPETTHWMPLPEPPQDA